MCIRDRFDIYYLEGISYEADLVNAGVKEGVITKAGSWLQLENAKIGQGMDGAKTFLKENPAMAKKIREELLRPSRKQPPLASLGSGGEKA